MRIGTRTSPEHGRRCPFYSFALAFPFLAEFWKEEILLPSKVVTEGFVEEEILAGASTLGGEAGAKVINRPRRMGSGRLNVIQKPSLTVERVPDTRRGGGQGLGGGPPPKIAGAEAYICGRPAARLTSQQDCPSAQPFSAGSHPR